MVNPTVPRFDFCALKYLNMWLTGEDQWVRAMDEGEKKEKLEAMARFAGAYRISRNLHRKYEERQGEPLARFEPVLDIIDPLVRSDFDGDKLLPTIQSVRAAISNRYGGRGVLSATTKFLWLKLRRPIVIYDRQSRVALGLKSSEIEPFLLRWRQAFETQAAAIAAACHRLGAVRDYCVNPDALTADFMHRVVDSPWFHERTFDIYLWTIGAAD